MATTQERKPLIFVGIPCYREVAPEILEDFMRFMYHLGRRMPEYDFYLGIKTKSEQFRARNEIASGALQVGADWLLMLDDDMIINHMIDSGPTSDYGFLADLIAHDKDVCGILYYQRSGTMAPVLMRKLEGTNGYRFLRDDEIEGKLQKVDVAGGGCLLIKTRVLDKLASPLFEPEFAYGTDIQLCRKAGDKGFEIWADTAIEFGHLRSERTVISSRNRQQFLTDILPGEVKKQFIASDIYNRLLEDGVEYTGYQDLEAMQTVSSMFLKEWKNRPPEQPDADWYREYPRERIARQIAFNTMSQHKRQMTEFIISSTDHRKPLHILDYGCGVGIPAFTFAEKGHQVTTADISGTGTFDFFKWRVTKHNLWSNVKTYDILDRRANLGATKFDVIVVMDVLEHIPEWRDVLRELADHLAPMGILFSNNGILDDDLHPEHYTLDNREFIQECMKHGLMPFNPITFVKRTASEKVGP